MLLGIHAECQHRRTLLAQLVDEQQQLSAHQQAAEAIHLRQRAFSAAPADPQHASPRLVGLTKLAHTWQDDVALISLDLDARQQRIHLEVVTPTLASLLDFVSRLQQGPAKVGLESHAHDPSLPLPWKIRATLNLEYDHAS